MSNATKRPSSHEPIYPPKKRALYKHQQEIEDKENSAVIHQSHAGRQQEQWRKSNNGFSFLRESLTNIHDGVLSNQSLLDGRHFHPAYQKEFTRPRSDSLHSVHSQYSDLSDTAVSMASRESSPYTVSGVNEMRTPERTPLSALATVGSNISKPLFPASDSESCHSDSPSPESATPTSHRHGNRTGLDHVVIQDAIGNTMRNALQREWDHPNVNNIKKAHDNEVNGIINFKQYNPMNEFSLIHSTSVGLNVTALHEVDQMEVNQLQINQSNGRKVISSQSESAKISSAGSSVKPMLSLIEKFNEEAMKKKSDSNINRNLSSSEESMIRDVSNLSSGGMKYNCSICGLEFGQRSELGVHMKKTHDSQRGKCRLCFIDFGNAEKLNHHMKSDHLGVNPYKCEHCDREFSQYNNLRRHMRVHRDKIFKCNLCDREFNEEFYLTMHMGTHTGKRVYSCGVCNACFPSNHELKQHVKTHAPSELHTCDICNKSFSKACVLRQHKKGHTGERPHKCEKCMKTFIHRHHLTMHMRSHTDSKPYTCEICSKEFYQSSHLYKHMRSHEEGETVQDAVRGPLDTGNNGINTPCGTNTSQVPTTLDVKEKILDKLRSDRFKVSEPQANLNIKTGLPESAKGDYLGIVAELPKENTEVNFRTNEECSKHPFYLVKKPLNNSTADVRCDLSLTKQHSVDQLTYLPVNDNSISSKCNAEGGMLKMNSDASYARGKSPDRGNRDKDHRNTAVRTKTRHEISPNRLTSHLPNHLTRTEQRKHDEVQNRYEVKPNFDKPHQWSNASNLYNLPYINQYPLPGNLPPGFSISGHHGDISTGMDGAMFRQHYDNGAFYPHPLLNHTAPSSNPLYMAYNTHLQSYLHHMYMINPSLLAHSPSYLHGNPYFPSNIASPNNHLLYGNQPQRPIDSQSSEQFTMNPLSKKSCPNGRRLLSVKTGKVPEINEQRDSKKINREKCESDEHETHTDLVNNFCRKVNEVVEKSIKIRENSREKLREKDISFDDVRDDTLVGESDTRTEVAEELVKLSERFTNKCRQDIAAGAALLTEGGSDGRIVPDYVYQSRSETPRKESEQKMAMDLSRKCESEETGKGESLREMVKEMDSAKYVSNDAAYVDGRSEEIGSVQMDDVGKVGDEIVQFKGDVEEMGAQDMDYDDSLEEHRLEIDMGEEEAEYVEENGRSDIEDVEENRSEVEQQKEEMLKKTVIEEKSDTDKHVVKNCDAGGTGRCDDFDDEDCDKKGKANPYSPVAVSRHGWHEALAGNIPDSLVDVSNVPSKLKTTVTAESPLGSGEYKMTTHTEDKYKKCEIYGDSIPRSDLIKNMDKYMEEISTKVNSKVKSNFICCVCFENFNSSESLEQHQVVHLQSEPVRHLCRLCGQSFALPNDLQCHMVLKHRCNKSTPDKGIKRSHSRLGSEAGNTGQSKFGEVFNGQPGENLKHWMDGLNGDNREGDKSKKAGVENVDMTYKDREILVMGKKSFVENSICDDVESCFWSKKSEGENKINLQENRMIENENQTSEFLVQTVGRLNSVKSVSNMENTNKAAKVRDDESFECNVCGEYFEVVDMFEDHMKLHGVGKPYKCDMCGRGFSHRHNLTRHKMSHNTKNFTCTICSRTFKEQFYLQMHMKTHTEDKCKTCEICGESILRSDLITHMDKHMGEISTNPTYAQIGSRVKEIRTFGECGSRKNSVVKDNCIIRDPNHRSSEAIRSKVLSDVSRRHENLENRSPRKPSKQAFRQLENLDFASNVR